MTETATNNASSFNRIDEDDTCDVCGRQGRVAALHSRSATGSIGHVLSLCRDCHGHEAFDAIDARNEPEATIAAPSSFNHIVQDDTCIACGHQGEVVALHALSAQGSVSHVLSLCRTCQGPKAFDAIKEKS